MEQHDNKYIAVAYKLYADIDGKRELKEINMSFHAGYVYDDDLPQKTDCGYK